MINLNNKEKLLEDSKYYTKAYKRVYNALKLKTYAFPDFTKYMEVRTEKINFNKKEIEFDRPVSEKSPLGPCDNEQSLLNELYYLTSPNRAFNWYFVKKCILVSNNDKHFLLDRRRNIIIIYTDVEISEKTVSIFKERDSYWNDETIFKDLEFLSYFAKTYYDYSKDGIFYINTCIKSIVFDKIPYISEKLFYIDISQTDHIENHDYGISMVYHTCESLEKNNPDNKIQLIGENGLCIINEVTNKITFLQIFDKDALMQVYMLLTI